MKLIVGKYEKCIDLVKSENDRVFIFDLAFVPSGEPFREIDRFLWESGHQDSDPDSRFKNRYDGNVVVNITSWMGKRSNEYFEAFLYFLKDQASVVNSEVLIAEHVDDDSCSYLEKFFDIEKISFDGSEEPSVDKHGVIGFERF